MAELVRRPSVRLARVAEARQRRQPGLGGVPANLSDVGDLVQTRDLPLSLASCRVPFREAADQRPDPLSKLEREMRGGGSHQLAHILDCDLSAITQAVWVLRLAHLEPCGTASRRLSISAWTGIEIAL